MLRMKDVSIRDYDVRLMELINLESPYGEAFGDDKVVETMRISLLNEFLKWHAISKTL